MDAIRCEALTKRYGDIIALNELCLTIEEGSIFGFLGPNGAGKTTALRLLTGLGVPTSGTAWVAGIAVSRDSMSLHRTIGFLPEEPAFYNWMTAREFLMFVGELFQLPSNENNRRCNELLELVDLQEDAGRKIGSYSRGMRQRLGIAQALVNQPSVLFLDEPCSALDPVGRRDVLALLQRLNTETTIFMSTHILSDVERVCNHVGIINEGRLIAQSPIEELRETYARSVFELQFDEDAAPLISSLETRPWVAKMERISPNDVPVLRLFASDLETAKHELPKAVAESRLTLTRYELTLPSLEDIFVELVGTRRSS